MYVNRCYNFWRYKCDQERSKKIFKFEALKTEIQYMWNVATKVIAVLTGANGTISKSLRKYLATF